VGFSLLVGRKRLSLPCLTDEMENGRQQCRSQVAEIDPKSFSEILFLLLVIFCVLIFGG